MLNQKSGPFPGLNTETPPICVLGLVSSGVMLERLSPCHHVSFCFAMFSCPRPCFVERDNAASSWFLLQNVAVTLFIYVFLFFSGWSHVKIPAMLSAVWIQKMVWSEQMDTSPPTAGTERCFCCSPDQKLLFRVKYVLLSYVLHCTSEAKSFYVLLWTGAFLNWRLYTILEKQPSTGQLGENCFPFSVLGHGCRFHPMSLSPTSGSFLYFCSSQQRKK